MTHDEMTALMRRLTDNGRLIEAGYISLLIAVFPPDTPPHQVLEMRKVFMAGAAHLFSSIMTILDPGKEPTEGDMRRMELISDELTAFGQSMMADLPTEGRA